MPPTVTTDSPSDVTATSATLNGSVTLNDDTDGSYTFTWGTSTSGTGLGSSTGTVPANSSDFPVSASMSSLSPGTTYHYQLCATNTFDTACDTVQQLTTLPAAPDATTGSGSASTTSTSATLNGTVNPNGDTTSFVFYYDTTSHSAGTCGAYASSTASGSAGAAPGSTPVTKTLTGLSANTTYYFRLSASNNEGTTCSGVESSFTTPDAPSPTTGAASPVGTTTATLSGTINPNGAGLTSAVFRYCDASVCSDASTGVAATATPSGTNPVTATANLNGLATGKTFRYTLCATNAWGTRCDPTSHTFTTDTPPTAVLTENKTAPGPGAVSFNGSASSDPDAGDSITWSLDFGDGSHQTGSGTPGSDIQHTYANPGSYTAKLTVTDSHGASATSTITVVVPSITVANPSHNEGNSGTTNFVFVVTLSAVSTHDVTVAYATADGTATAGSDYTSTSGTFTIPAGTNCTTSPATNSACQIVVPVTGDTIYENNETFALNLSNPTGATLTNISATGTIVNDDQPPKVMIDNGATLEGNTGSVIGSGHSWSGGNLQLNDASGFPSSFGAHTFFISTPGSSFVGGPYTYTGVSGNTLTGVTPASGTVTADQIAFQPRTITLSVVLCDPQLTTQNDPADCVSTHSGLDATVKYASSNGQSITTGIPVVEGQDYVANSGTLTIPAGQASADITYETIPNTTPENPQNPGDDLTRWFNVLISNATNGTIVSNLGTAKIIEDDGLNPPTATTGTASSIGADHATVAGTVNPKGDATPTIFVQYGPTDSYGSQTAIQSLPAGTSDQSLTFSLTGLSPGTTYHYQLVASHADNSTGYGKDLTFTTDRLPIAVLGANKTSGAPPLTVTFDGSGSSDPDGSIASWSLNFGDGSSTSGNGAVPSSIPHKYTSACNCTASLTVTDNQGVQSGAATVAIKVGNSTPTPTTGGPKNPILSHYTTSVLGPTSAKVVFPVDPNGAPTNAWVEYGKTSSYGLLSNAVGVPAGSPKTVTVTLKGLTPNTHYHYRLAAAHTTDSGAADSQDLTFKTPKATPMGISLGTKVVRLTATDLVPLTFSCKGNALPSCKGQALLELGNAPVGFKSFSVAKGHRKLVSVPLKKTLLRRLSGSSGLHLDLTLQVRTGMKGKSGLTTQPITVLPPLKAKPKH